MYRRKRTRGKMRSWENLGCGIFLVVVGTIVNGMPDYSGLPSGPYCARRYPGCCPDRQDDCNAPILGSLCYCDEFCDRFREEDCCPDYWSHCKGIDTNVTEPPPEPIKRSYLLRFGRVFRFTAFIFRLQDATTRESITTMAKCSR